MALAIKMKAQGADEPYDYQIYAQFPAVHLTQVLTLANKNTGFLSAFSHFLPTNQKQKSDNRCLLACIMAFGTNHSLYQMADISDISYDSLRGTANNFVRIDTPSAASDILVNATAKLPMFRHYNIGEDGIHTSSDGQKFTTRFDTANARHSPKYFGLNRGVVNYSLVANHVPIHAKIIGAHEHESHLVFDILFNNTSEIRPDIHSVDTHGTNQINFAVLDFFGYQFAPRYAKLTKKAEGLSTFKVLSDHEGDIVHPSRTADTSLINDEWENIQRIMVFLALKSTT